MQHSLDIASQPAASMIDPKLLARVSKGDRQAFSQLYDQSCTVLYGFARRMLGNDEEAADLLQELYREIWSKSVRYDIGRGIPIAWLISLTRSRAIDRRRARTLQPDRQRTEPITPHSTDYDQDPKQSLFESQADQELRTLVCEALATLPPGQQQAIDLAYHEGLSYLEIAERLDQPPGAVKTRIKLGMAKLREAFRCYGEQNTRI